jgi:hypothetical protein
MTAAQSAARAAAGIPKYDPRMTRRERMDRTAALMRAGLHVAPSKRYRRAWDSINGWYRRHACFVCRLRGICDHREPLVVAALLGIPDDVLTNYGGIL